MNTPNKIDALDEALRVIFLESAKDLDSVNAEKEMSQILSSTDVVMTVEKRTLLLDKLQSIIVSLSFGQLLQQELNNMGINDEVAAEKSSLPISIIKELKDDVIYTNNVPIKLLKNLLSYLNISFKSIEESVRKTFEILHSQSAVKNSSFLGFSPAFRKGHYASRETLIRNSQTTDGKELFENKEALEKYLSRLNELMNS